MNMMDVVERPYRPESIPDFKPGDTVKVAVKVKEGNRERIQHFQGVVIGRKGNGTREMFTVRKISAGIGVERIFPLCSPLLSSIKVVKKGDVRRAKLYYLRHKKGKAAKVKEKDIFRRKEAAEASTESGEA